jgi:hypothetical protein
MAQHHSKPHQAGLAWRVLLITLLLLGLQISGPVMAAQIDFGPNGCTLQDAIRSANNDAATGNCAAGSGHDVLVSPDFWSIVINSQLPTITTDMTITTTSASGLLTVSGDDLHAIMKITGIDTEVTLERVSLTEGNANLIKGAGLHIEDAQVTLSDCVVSENRSIARFGGGVYIEDGVLVVDNCSFEDNQIRNTEATHANGGAIYAQNSVVSISRSRFVGNDAWQRLQSIDGDLRYWDKGFGASVFMNGGDLTVEESLFSEDDSAVHGTATIADISNSTFNRLSSGYHDYRGHVYFDNSASLNLNHVTMKSSFFIEDSILIMTNSILRGDCNIQASTSWVVDAGNLYNTQGFSCPNTGNQFYDPKLTTLADNGGPTETIAVLYTSDAVNAGDLTYCLPTDQRGVSRDAACDVGAYEVADFVDIAVAGQLNASPPYVHAQEMIYNVTVTNNSLSVINEVSIDVDLQNAFITDIDYSQCPSFPCILNGIQGSQQITIPVHVMLSTVNSSFALDIEANQTLNSTYTDTNPGNNTAGLAGTIEAGADLAVNMELLSQGNHFIGEVIQYAATVENLGFDQPNDVSLEFTPSGLSLLSFQGCDSVNGTTCELGTIANGNSELITINAQITAAVFDAVAEVEATLLDNNLANNTDLQGNNGALGQTNLTVEVVPEFNPPYYSYGYMKFNVKIATGNDPASNIRVWTDYPGADFIGCSHTWNIDGYCEVSAIAANSSVIVTFDYFNPITDAGTQQSFAYSALAIPGETDTDLQDNESMINVNITATADMLVQLDLVNPGPHLIGQELEFHLRAVNGGLNHANNVEIDLLPVNLSLVWASGQQCQTEHCDITLMERFNEENMVLVYRIDDAGDFSLEAQIDASQADLNTGNNSDVIMGSAELPEFDLIFADDFE